jgi:hypothetical protein
MLYLLPCQCGHRTAVRTSQAGSQILCAGCQASLEVPTIAGLSRLEKQDDSAAKNPQRTTSKPRWNPLRGILVATSFLLMFFGLFKCGFYAYYRYQTPTNFTVEDLDRELDAHSATLVPAEAWDMWLSLHESGLGAKKTPEAFRLKRSLEQSDAVMKKWAWATGVASLIFVLGTFWRSKSR